jgi:hypothetical protein
VKLATVVHCSVVGFQISPAKTAPEGSSKPTALVPPVTRTWPSGRRVALWLRRANAIGLVGRHAGDGALRSITTPAWVAGYPPPTFRTFPSSYITEEPYSRSPIPVKPTKDQEPAPDVSRYRVVSLGPAANTFPFGARCM